MTNWIQSPFFEDAASNGLESSAGDNDVIITLKEKWHDDFLSVTSESLSEESTRIARPAVSFHYSLNCIRLALT